MGNIIGTIHTDAVLTNFALGFKNQALVGDVVMPSIMVGKDSDKYYTYDKSNFRTSEDDLWVKATTAKEVQLRVSSDSYLTQRRALKEFVDDEDVRNADNPLSPMRDATEDLTDRLSLKAEKRVATAIRTVGNNGGSVTLAGVTQWSDFANSDPISDIETGLENVRSLIAQRANTLVLPESVFNKLRQHPDIVDRVKYTQVGVVTEQLIAQIFRLNQVVVAGAIENSAVEGQADVLEDVWGKDAWIGYVNPRPGIKQLTWGLQFRSQNWTTERWRDEEKGGTMVRVRINDTQKVVASGAGYLIKNAVA